LIGKVNITVRIELDIAYRVCYLVNELQFSKEIILQVIFNAPEFVNQVYFVAENLTQNLRYVLFNSTSFNNYKNQGGLKISYFWFYFLAQHKYEFFKAQQQRWTNVLLKLPKNRGEQCQYNTFNGNKKIEKFDSTKAKRRRMYVKI